MTRHLSPQFSGLLARARSPRPPASLLPIATLLLATWMGFLAHDWKAGAAILLLWAAWHFLPRIGNSHVLFFAFVYEWAQVSLGILYKALTGRSTPVMLRFDPQPMFLLGLITLACMVAGMRLGFSLLGGRSAPRNSVYAPSFSWPVLRNLYLVFAFLDPVLIRLAFRYPALEQSIMVVSYLHYVLMLMVLYRLLHPKPRWAFITAVILGEVAFGFTSYFANFREAEVLAGLALFDNFKPRKTSNWISLVALGGLVFASATAWTAIKPQYRFVLRTRQISGWDRLRLVDDLLSQLQPEDLRQATDKTVDRIWAIYYPALALERVPMLVPFQNGKIFWGAVRFAVEPRILFPNKGVLPSDSVEVRKYAGVMVAGARQGTSIAFGYAAESYCDYGVPGMFVPIFAFFFFMGLAYGWFSRQIRHRDLTVAVTTTIFWLSLYQFEMAWVKRIGLMGNLLLFLGIITLACDRFLLKNRRARLFRRMQQEMPAWMPPLVARMAVSPPPAPADHPEDSNE